MQYSYYVAGLFMDFYKAFENANNEDNGIRMKPTIRTQKSLMRYISKQYQHAYITIQYDTKYQ